MKMYGMFAEAEIDSENKIIVGQFPSNRHIETKGWTSIEWFSRQMKSKAKQFLQYDLFYLT